MHSPLIFQPHKFQPLIASYNFPIDNSLKMKTLIDQLDYIYSNQTRSFKINLAFGYIMQNIETKEYRYFKVYENQNILPVPYKISKHKDIEQLIEYLKQIDIINLIMQDRENTKYKLILLTNVLYTLASYDFTLGNSDGLPSYITKRNKTIMPFEKNHLKQKYKDNLCFFRCLTGHLYPKILKKRKYKEYEGVVNNLFDKCPGLTKRKSIRVTALFQKLKRAWHILTRLSWRAVATS